MDTQPQPQSSNITANMIPVCLVTREIVSHEAAQSVVDELVIARKDFNFSVVGITQKLDQVRELVEVHKPMVLIVGVFRSIIQDEIEQIARDSNGSSGQLKYVVKVPPRLGEKGDNAEALVEFMREAFSTMSFEQDD